MSVPPPTYCPAGIWTRLYTGPSAAPGFFPLLVLGPEPGFAVGLQRWSDTPPFYWSGTWAILPFMIASYNTVDIWGPFLPSVFTSILVNPGIAAYMKIG